MLLLAGRPLLESSLDALHFAGVREVCLVVNHLAEQIVRFVGNGARWNLAVAYAGQSKLTGTAHALKAARAFIDRPCFVLAADYCLPEDYLARLSQYYARCGADIVAALKPLSEQEMSQRSGVRFGALGQVVEVIEKPAAGQAPSGFGASLIYIVPPAIRGYLRDVPLSWTGEAEIATVLNRLIADRYLMSGLLMEEPLEWWPEANTAEMAPVVMRL